MLVIFAACVHDSFMARGFHGTVVCLTRLASFLAPLANHLVGGPAQTICFNWRPLNIVEINLNLVGTGLRGNVTGCYLIVNTTCVNVPRRH